MRHSTGNCFPRFLLVLAILFTVSHGFTQTTVGTGSIVGNVTDPTGAVVNGAKVTITNVATGQLISLATNAAGAYNSGALVPGNYKVLIAAKGFRSSSVALTVLVGNTATGNVQLEIGQENQVIEVQGAAVQVNTEQATVQGVLSSEQIENLPVNGRNFLDLAQLEPGVQIQDGQSFDPTKAGYSSISFGGRFGRTARIEVDGSGTAYASGIVSSVPAVAIWRPGRRADQEGSVVLFHRWRAHAPARSSAGGGG